MRDTHLFFNSIAERATRGPAVGLALVISMCIATTAQLAAQSYPADSFPAPNRPVSAIVAPRWVAERERDALGEADRVMTALAVRRGTVVADIGAGDGYYVARLAPRVGPEGRVYGVDVEPNYLAMLEQRVSRAKWTNVEVIASEPHDPKLPANTVDVALFIHMYHEITQPFGLLYHLAFAMKPGGLIGVVDLDGPTDRHGTPPQLLRCEFEALGYQWVRRATLADGAYLITFRAPSVDERVATPSAVRQRVAAAKCRS